MSKNKGRATEAVVVITKNPAEIGTIVKTTGLAVVQSAPKIGRIGKSRLVDAETMKKVREEVQTLALDINTHYQDLGAVLADPENLGWESHHIADEEQQLTDAVFNTSEGKAREVVTLACAQAMLTYFPQTMVGLNHFGDHGIAIGFFKLWTPGSLKYFIELPIGPKYVWTRLLSEIPNAMSVLGPLTGISMTVMNIVQAYGLEKIAGFEKQAVSFLDVLAAKYGDTVARISVYNGEKRVWQYVQIQVSEGMITAVDAMGSPQTEELVGSTIPLHSLPSTTGFEHRALKGMTPKQVSVMYEFRRFLQKAIARAQHERQQVKTSPALPPPQSKAASADEN